MSTSAGETTPAVEEVVSVLHVEQLVGGETYFAFQSIMHFDYSVDIVFLRAEGGVKFLSRFFYVLLLLLQSSD
jgi:hypothetical protein